MNWASGMMTWLSRLLPRKAPCCCRTPITSKGLSPIRTFLPNGGLALEQVGRHLRADDAHRPAPFGIRGGKETSLRHGNGAGVQKLIVRPDDADAVGAALVVFDVRLVEAVGATARARVICFSSCLTWERVMSRRFCIVVPLLLRMDEPFGALHVEHVRPDEGDAFEKRAVQAFNCRAHQRHGHNADHDPQGGQDRAHLVGADGRPRKC